MHTFCLMLSECLRIIKCTNYQNSVRVNMVTIQMKDLNFVKSKCCWQVLFCRCHPESSVINHKAFNDGFHLMSFKKIDIIVDNINLFLRTFSICWWKKWNLEPELNFLYFWGFIMHFSCDSMNKSTHPPPTPYLIGKFVTKKQKLDPEMSYLFFFQVCDMSFLEEYIQIHRVWYIWYIFSLEYTYALLPDEIDFNIKHIIEYRKEYCTKLNQCFIKEV